MNIYVVLIGEYEDTEVAGVFTSLEAAQAAYPLKTVPEYRGPGGYSPERQGEWRAMSDKHGRPYWLNGLEGEDAVTIVERSLQFPNEERE